MAALDYIRPQGPAWMVVLKIVARLFAVVLGLLMIMPSLMASDSGTPEAINGALILLFASVLMILAGILGNIGLVGLVIVSFIFCFTIARAGLWLQRFYLIVALPVATFLIIACQFHLIDCGQVMASLSLTTRRTQEATAQPNYEILSTFDENYNLSGQYDSV